MGRNRWSAGQWRDYRAANGERLNRLQRERRSRGRVRGDRSDEYRKRRLHHVAPPPLGPLFPHLNHGTSIAFWEDELRMDLEQEAALARLEHRSVSRAVRRYRNRERDWYLATTGSLELVS